MCARQIIAVTEEGHLGWCKGDTTEESIKVQELGLQRDFWMHKKEMRSQNKITIRIKKIQDEVQQRLRKDKQEEYKRFAEG